MSLKNIAYRDINIYYTVIGEGKPVMLIHGFAEDSDVWKHQVEFLKDHYRLIIPDIPGSGKSALVENGDIDAYAEIMKQIIDNEDIAQLTIVGHSMGGYITLAFAEKYPNLLNSFVLFHSSAFADNEEKKQTRLKAIEFIKTHGVNAFLQTSTPGLFGDEFKTAHGEEVTALIERGNNFSKEALIQYYHAMISRPDRTKVLESFSKPVLFIIGEHDKAVPMEAGLKQSHIPSISHVSILQKSAHMGMWEEKVKANEVLFTFLQQTN